MANTTNFGWETPDDTDLVKDGASAMRTLGNAIDTSLVDLKGGTTGQVLSKATNTDMDFSWISKDDLAGSYTTFTPSWINITVGNGTSVGRYFKFGKFIHVEAYLTFGSTTSISGSIGLTVPVTAATAGYYLKGIAQFQDTGTQNYQGAILSPGDSDFYFYAANASGTYLHNGNNVNATTPYTWTNTDVLYTNFVYRAA